MHASYVAIHSNYWWADVRCVGNDFDGEEYNGYPVNSARRNGNAEYYDDVPSRGVRVFKLKLFLLF